MSTAIERPREDESAALVVKLRAATRDLALRAMFRNLEVNIGKILRVMMM